ncbi:hypothetical protein Patl1_10288 [Pistacia atlantica]|uniref:Uncharacterized protein n=1 Tax=Pistacia atlantica TaxID=434234 RepID=A0ACC1A543_9ROSI|nr:hypothetical protein Patl1_10288 [Pistacia atlantica]
MAATLPKLGSSLAVPCVQEIAKKPLTRVPQRYVRPDQENPFVSNNNSVLQVPVVDMQRLLSADFMDSELDKLHQACKEWGFFQLKLDWGDMFHYSPNSFEETAPLPQAPSLLQL